MLASIKIDKWENAKDLLFYSPIDFKKNLQLICSKSLDKFVIINWKNTMNVKIFFAKLIASTS